MVAVIKKLKKSSKMMFSESFRCKVLIVCVFIINIKNVLCFSCSEDCACGLTSAWCPKLNSQVWLSSFPREQELLVRCLDRREVDYEFLQEMKVGCTEVFTYLRISDCKFSLIRTFDSIVEKLHLETILKLKYECNGADERRLLKAEYLEGFKQLKDFEVRSIDDLEIAENFFQHTIKLENLALSLKEVEYPDNVFDPLKSLKKLKLKNNGKPKEFRVNFNHNNLESLELIGFKLIDLTKDSFQNTSNIRTLILKHNLISSLGADVFDNLIMLNSIVLCENNIPFLPKDLFHKNRNLMYIKMENNKLEMKGLFDQLFAGLNYLRDIDFVNSEVEITPENVFQQSINIMRINLSNNSLKLLPDDLFKDQEKLEDLDLSHNELMEVTEATISNIRSLKILRLSYNALRKIHQ